MFDALFWARRRTRPRTEPRMFLGWLDQLVGALSMIILRGLPHDADDLASAPPYCYHTHHRVSLRLSEHAPHAPQHGPQHTIVLLSRTRAPASSHGPRALATHTRAAAHRSCNHSALDLSTHSARAMPSSSRARARTAARRRASHPRAAPPRARAARATTSAHQHMRDGSSHHTHGTNGRRRTTPPRTAGEEEGGRRPGCMRARSEGVDDGGA